MRTAFSNVWTPDLSCWARVPSGCLADVCLGVLKTSAVPWYVDLWDQASSLKPMSELTDCSAQCSWKVSHLIICSETSTSYNVRTVSVADLVSAQCSGMGRRSVESRNPELNDICLCTKKPRWSAEVRELYSIPPRNL